MKCINCRGENLEFFNESVEERRKRSWPYYVLLVISILILIIGIAGILITSLNLTIEEMKAISGKLNIEQTSSFNSKDLEYAKKAWTLFVSLAIIGGIMTFFFIISSLRPKTVKVYRVKVLCKDCGNQFLLLQDVKKTYEFYENIHKLVKKE